MPGESTTLSRWFEYIQRSRQNIAEFEDKKFALTSKRLEVFYPFCHNKIVFKNPNISDRLKDLNEDLLNAIGYSAKLKIVLSPHNTLSPRTLLLWKGNGPMVGEHPNPINKWVEEEAREYLANVLTNDFESEIEEFEKQRGYAVFLLNQLKELVGNVSYLPYYRQGIERYIWYELLKFIKGNKFDLNEDASTSKLDEDPHPSETHMILTYEHEEDHRLGRAKWHGESLIPDHLKGFASPIHPLVGPNSKCDLNEKSVWLKSSLLFSQWIVRLLGTYAFPHALFQLIYFRKSRMLSDTTSPIQSLKLSLSKVKVLTSSKRAFVIGLLEIKDCSTTLISTEVMVGLLEDSEDGVVYWAIDVSEASGLVSELLGAKQFCFVELRTLMVATDWADPQAMAQLAVAGHARALLEWHTMARFCGFCGGKTVPKEAGRRKQCSNELCKKRIYPRVDPVVIMLVIDKENDCVLLSRQSRFVPRMWSCLAGFIEPGETLEEAVRRETWEETGIEVGEVVYHSSQPWPVGPSSMPCQLMVGFFAYAKSLEINVDKEELEDAKWHSREDVKKALTFAEYKKAQNTAAAKVEQMCKGVEKGQNLSADFNLESGELAPMFVPGPYAIAHHLISTWANQVVLNGVEIQKQATVEVAIRCDFVSIFSLAGTTVHV
ncbi:hypothetical protein BUALT_Bualt12G0095500 [Buddleja alternifolia]|uniref:NAD(+) diphosphatase n=1 Tax=Buddleja alternifolia TaxID=168488 RepID=A0AAV6X0C8_9LAMI|nr:hypothetical protein BUALT_Bualt12G0095500 [Buddleja alternifolia]